MVSFQPKQWVTYIIAALRFKQYPISIGPSNSYSILFRGLNR